MSFDLPPVNLAGLAAPQRVGPDLSAPERATAPALAQPAAKPMRAGLAFEGWSAQPSAPAVLGDRPYPGSAADPSAVADAIAALIFEQD